MRVAEGVREEIASMIADEVRDPGAAGAVVTRVEMASDLKSRFFSSVFANIAVSGSL